MRAARAAAIVLTAACLAGVPCSGALAGDAENPYPGYHSDVYAAPANWLCRGDTDDPCDHDLDANVVEPHRATRVSKWRAARDPKIDCFYVYPTISTDPGGNSDLIAGADQELFVARQQAARLGSVCRVFAPVYRQVTLTALVGRLTGNPIPSNSALADADLLDAWKHYIANDNDGRGVLLIGHSQGAARLTTLLRNEIDPNPVLRDRLVSAVLLGTNFQVPANADVGGDLANIPLCHSPRDTGCVITYATFRETAPPPSNSLFGRSLRAGMKAACTNPAALAGGSATLLPYLPTDGKTLPIFPAPLPTWFDPPGEATIDKSFVSLPRFFTAECVERNGFNYLSLRIKGDPADPRIDNIGGDLTPDWGLHLVDANIAMGDLVAIARSQARVYHARHR